MVAANNDLSISGFLMSLLSMAFTLICCLGELFDNAIGAGAMNITLNLDTVALMVSMSDDGSGMDKDELKRASILYQRSEASDTKQGCFGIGLQAACVVITNLENPTHIISKTVNTELVELKQDWPDIIASDEYVNKVRTGDDLSRNCEDVWQEHRVSEAQGTVINIKTTQKNMDKLVEMTTSNKIDNLVYVLGRTYRKSIKNGLKITIKIDGVVYKQVIAVDLLELEKTDPRNKQEVKLDVFFEEHSKSTRLYFTNQFTEKYGYVPDGKKTHRQVEKNRLKKLLVGHLRTECSSNRLDDRGKKDELVERLLSSHFGVDNESSDSDDDSESGDFEAKAKGDDKLRGGGRKFKVESPPSSFTLKSSMVYRSAYDTPEQWNDKQDYVFDHVGFDRPKPNKVGKTKMNQALYNGMGGRDYIRGDKSICSVLIDKSKRAGWNYMFHDNSRHELSFTHEHDWLVSLLTNKSRLDERAMEVCVTDTLKYIDSEFERKMVGLYGDAVAATAAAPEPELVLPPPPVGVGLNIDAVVSIIQRSNAVVDGVGPNIDAAVPIIQQSNAVVDGVGPNIDEVPITYEMAQDLNNIESNSEGTDTDDSDTASESDLEVSPPAPIVTNVSASTQIRYLAVDSLRLLEQMKVSNRHLSEFETLLETVIRKHMSETSDENSNMWFRFMTPDQKYNMTIELIGQKYSGMYMSYPMLCGSDVYNCYTQLFTNN